MDVPWLPEAAKSPNICSVETAPRILIVEDHMLLAVELADLLVEIGCEPVGCAFQGWRPADPADGDQRFQLIATSDSTRTRPAFAMRR
jgi:hypothetical protein